MNWKAIPIKDRAKVFKDISINLDKQKKLGLMRNMYEGEHVYIVSCGPSLAEIPQKTLLDNLSKKVVMTIKQAYGKVGSITDVHHFNCNNFTNYNLSETISVASAGQGSLDAMRRNLWGNIDVDLFFPVINNGRTVCHDDNWENNTYENSPSTRQWGPGTLIETTIFTAVHTGAKHISLIGIDFGPPEWDESKDGIYLPHFYDSESDKKPENSPKGELFYGENKLVIEGTRQIKKWLASKNISITVDSKNSYVHKSIDRNFWLYE